MVVPQELCWCGRLRGEGCSAVWVLGLCWTDQLQLCAASAVEAFEMLHITLETADPCSPSHSTRWSHGAASTAQLWQSVGSTVMALIKHPLIGFCYSELYNRGRSARLHPTQFLRQLHALLALPPRTAAVPEPRLPALRGCQQGGV